MSAVKAVIEKQGTVLECHHQEFGQIHQSFSNIEQTLQNLTAQIQALQPQQVSQPLPPAEVFVSNQLAPTPPVREPRLPAPPPYAGEPGTCRAFLTQCTLNMELQTSALPTERSRIAFVISLLTGKARDWATAIWEANASCCSSFKSFSDEMLKVFDRSLKGKEAAKELLNLKQGSRSVYDYAIEFRTLAASVDWNPNALYDAFYNGLSDLVLDEISPLELPDSLEGLIDLTGKLDSRMRKRDIWRGAKYQSYVPTSTRTISTPLDSDSEPMQIGRTRISAEERRRRRETNSCFYCGNAGHFASRCPLKGNAHP